MATPAHLKTRTSPAVLHIRAPQAITPGRSFHDDQSRIRQLEDRTQISEQVIKYAMGVDRRDWEMFAGCFTDPVYADFSGGGIPTATVSRADLVARISAVLNGFTATQHIRPTTSSNLTPRIRTGRSATPTCTRSTC